MRPPLSSTHEVVTTSLYHPYRRRRRRRRHPSTPMLVTSYWLSTKVSVFRSFKNDCLY